MPRRVVPHISDVAEDIGGRPCDGDVPFDLHLWLPTVAFVSLTRAHRPAVGYCPLNLWVLLCRGAVRSRSGSSEKPHHRHTEHPLANDAVAEVDEPRVERAGPDEFEVRPAFVPGEVWDATADEDRVDDEPILVDQIGRGRFGGQRRAADRDLALSRLGS